MKCHNGVQLLVILLLVLGGINMGLVGIFDYNLIGTIFSHVPVLGKVLYILIGFAALYHLFHLCQSCRSSS